MGFKHSVLLDADKCKGCTHCLRRCPTEAIRVREGRALIDDTSCIDCGECIRVCPYKAKKAVTDRLGDLDGSKQSYAVRIMTGVSSPRARIWRVTSMPFISGSRQSMM